VVNVEVVVFLLVALFSIIRGIFRFFKWVARQSKGIPTGSNPIQQAMAEAQRQSQAPQARQGPPPAQALRPTQTLSARAPALAPARPMPRQPQAGGPAVQREATDADFRRQERELMTEEPAALGVSLQSSAPTVVRVQGLFGGSDDLVRAIILREALGPPLSRRRPSSPDAPRPSP